MDIQNITKLDPATLRQYLMSYYQSKRWELDPEFNLFGIRAKDNVSNLLYCDILGMFSSNNSIIGSGTTNPSVFYAKNPMNKSGTAHVIPGFYPDLFTIGKHNPGSDIEHDAFIQAGFISVRRDLNKNSKIDTFEPVERGDYQCINFHSQFGHRAEIGYWSAGCQVIYDMALLKQLITLAKQTLKYKKTNRISYGLLLSEEL